MNGKIMIPAVQDQLDEPVFSFLIFLLIHDWTPSLIEGKRIIND